jgi:pyruvate kinase
MPLTRTKIIATLGPASWDEPVLTALMEAGADCFRINCSHTDHEGIRRQVARVRRAAMRRGAAIAILLDLQGPKIRLGTVDGTFELAKGDLLTVAMDPQVVGPGSGDHPRVGTTYPEMAQDVAVGDEVLFADGAVGGAVEAVRLDTTPPEVDVRIGFGGPLSSNKGLNLPQTAMSVPSLTDKDVGDLETGIDVGVDFVALSFVRGPADVLELRSHLDRLGAKVLVIAKIEKPQAVEAIDAILEVSDGVMVARGDLGVEVSIEKVPVYQKRIIAAGQRHGKIVITATQMLDSMERNPRPTRAETTDVANAILDGTDVIMLSGETSIGRYPVEAVRTMDRIASEVESSPFFHPTPLKSFPALPEPSNTVIRAACFASSQRSLPLVVFTWSGASAIAVSKARLNVPIYALTPHDTVVDRLAMVFGVVPIKVPPVRSTDELIAAGESVLLGGGHLDRGQEIVVLAGRGPLRGATNVMKVYALGTDVEPDSGEGW